MSFDKQKQTQEKQQIGNLKTLNNFKHIRQTENRIRQITIYLSTNKTNNTKNIKSVILKH